MAFFTTITGGQYSFLAINTDTALDPLTVDTEAEGKAAFTDPLKFVEIKNMREFPSFGTPPNIVNVPVFGQPISAQIQAQSDAPNLSFTVNYTPEEWKTTSAPGSLVGDGKPYVFQLSLCSAKPPSLITTAGASGLGAVGNASWYFVGRLDAIQINTSVSDAVTAEIAVSMPTGRFYGPFTVAGA
jgi:hypothetical protein